MTNAYHLVPNLISQDTREAFEQLAAGAAAGEVVGGAVVVFIKGRRYTVDAFGACARNATLTLGCLQVLSQQLSEVIRMRDPGETR